MKFSSHQFTSAMQSACSRLCFNGLCIKPDKFYSTDQRHNQMTCPATKWCGVTDHRHNYETRHNDVVSWTSDSTHSNTFRQLKPSTFISLVEPPVSVYIFTIFIVTPNANLFSWPPRTRLLQFHQSLHSCLANATTSYAITFHHSTTKF